MSATEDPRCPKCESYRVIRSGIINEKQRYHCKSCSYFFTVDKIGKRIDSYYVTKALQLYIEGVSAREIERLLGISHVTIMNWVRSHGIKRSGTRHYHPTYKILTHAELVIHIQNKDNLHGAGSIITEVGDKFMLIKWERFRK